VLRASSSTAEIIHTMDQTAREERTPIEPLATEVQNLQLYSSY